MISHEINYIANSLIDRGKWDRCISQSPFCIAYAYSWYLDRICTRWDALISGDYEFVMPLVTNRKYGISYIYQPFFSQQLGVFSKHPIDESVIGDFLNAIPKSFRLIDMKLNIGNAATNLTIDSSENTTYHLSLNSSLEAIQSAYNTNTKRNIQKAHQNKLAVSVTSDVERFIAFTQSNLNEKAPEVKTQHYSAFQEIVHFALANRLGEICVASSDEGKWLAAVFFLKTDKSCIYLAASSNAEGKEKNAMFLLVDSFIQRNADHDLILDFEGSNIQGVARFYAGFGAMPKTYWSIRINRLPRLIRMLKK